MSNNNKSLNENEKKRLEKYNSKDSVSDAMDFRDTYAKASYAEQQRMKNGQSYENYKNVYSSTRKSDFFN